MSSVCDFKFLSGVSSSTKLGEGNVFSGWRNFFTSEGLQESGYAVLVFMVRGLVGERSALVKVNNNVADEIYPYPGANPSHWYVQIVHLANDVLVEGTNELTIEAALSVNPGPDRLVDEFQVKNIMCFTNNENIKQAGA